MSKNEIGLGGKPLFNDGCATFEETEYICDKCGAKWSGTVNLDQRRHDLPVKCGGLWWASGGEAMRRMAAGEMYGALLAAEAALVGPPDDADPNEALEKVRAALAKAGRRGP